MSTTAIVDQLRDAHATATSCRIVGAGTWLGAGQPVQDSGRRIDAGPLRGITEYVPGDLTLTARAGTPLVELAHETRANGQRLAIDPYGTDAGTIGATVATCSAGPSAAAFGTPRDQVLGLTFVTGTGDVVTAGGRVVKNVAGFDLVRLCTGAWGTLGVITDVSLRLRALPAADETLVIPVAADDARAVASAITALRALPFTFEAAELLDGATVRALALGDATGRALVVRAAASTDVVRAMRAALAVVGSAREAAPETWQAIRALDAAAEVSIRLSHAPGNLGRVWTAATRLADKLGGRATMSVTRAVVRVTAAAPHDVPDVAERVRGALGEALSAFDGTAIAERLPPGAWSAPELHRVRDDAMVLGKLTRGVRDAFDPARVLNRGILGAAGGDA